MKRILVVDDEQAAARLLKAALELTGDYQARVVHTPEDALDAIREFQPHLVLLDIIMPGMLGGDVAQAIRSDPAIGDIPIVFLTAAFQPHLVREHEGVAPSDPCVAKPADLAEIIRVIERHARREPPSHLASSAPPAPPPQP